MTLFLKVDRGGDSGAFYAGRMADSRQDVVLNAYSAFLDCIYDAVGRPAPFHLLDASRRAEIRVSDGVKRSFVPLLEYERARVEL